MKTGRSRQASKLLKAYSAITRLGPVACWPCWQEDSFNIHFISIFVVLLTITETSPYSFGNFRKLSLYKCFMPI